MVRVESLAESDAYGGLTVGGRVQALMLQFDKHRTRRPAIDTDVRLALPIVTLRFATFRYALQPHPGKRS